MAKIWLVEDDQNLANLTKIALVKSGHEVVVFHEAAPVVEQAANQAPDLILMDVMLPDLNGPQLVKILKKNAHLTDTPVIFLTALLSTEESELGLTVDKINYRTLGKPYKVDRLLELVKSVLS